MGRWTILLVLCLGETALAHAPDDGASLGETLRHLLFGSHHLPLLLATLVTLAALRFLVTRSPTRWQGPADSAKRPFRKRANDTSRKGRR